MANSDDTVKRSQSILKTDTKAKIKPTVFKTLAYAGIGVIGGGLASAVIGRPSFLVGLGLTGLGLYKDIAWLSPLGIGMMASTYRASVSSGVSGFDLKTETDNAKERLVSFKNGLFSKTYLDKVVKPTASASALEETTSGFGSVTANVNALNQIEQQLVASAMAYQNQNRGTSGYPDDMQGMNEEPDFSGF